MNESLSSCMYPASTTSSHPIDSSQSPIAPSRSSRPA